jgi:hypothetical protein
MEEDDPATIYDAAVGAWAAALTAWAAALRAHADEVGGVGGRAVAAR